MLRPKVAIPIVLVDWFIFGAEKWILGTVILI